MLEAEDLELVGAVARSAAGQTVGGRRTISATVEEALDAAATDVLIDFTKPGAVRGHAEAALRRGVGVVVGTSGLTADDYAELDAIAREAGAGLIAAGNFSVMAAVLFHSALLAAEELKAWEVIDYAYDGKPDAPSGTARELAERLSGVRTPKPTASGDDLIGPPEARGAQIGTTQVHSLRLPSFTVSTEVDLRRARRAALAAPRRRPERRALHRRDAAGRARGGGAGRRDARPGPAAVRGMTTPPEGAGTGVRRGLFVTGTDTGAGKTVVAGAVAAALTRRGARVAAFKPVVTGLDEPAAIGWAHDHALLAAAVGTTPEEVSPARFGPPVSPHLAAARAGTTLDVEALLDLAARGRERAPTCWSPRASAGCSSR